MLLQLVGIGLAGGMICLLFKQTRPELVLPTSLAVGAIMLWVVLGGTVSRRGPTARLAGTNWGRGVRRDAAEEPGNLLSGSTGGR